MMSKIKKIQILILLISISIFAFNGIKVRAEENKVLIIYDSYKEFGLEENKLNLLVQTILGTGNGVDIVNIDSYSKESIDKYKFLFVLYNNSSELPDGFIQDLLRFKGRIVWIGKNFDKLLENKQNIKYISNFSSKDESYNVLRKDIYKVINDREWDKQSVYLLIDEVYPFVDLGEFIKKIDFLYDQGIPFICSVMPVYENQDFDAMKRFCEVLRYAQSKGGKIILHSSIMKGNDIPGKDVQDKMSLAQQIYIKYGVYPLAIDIPESLLYKEDYKELVHCGNNIFIEKDNNIGVIDFKKYSIDGFDKVIDKIDITNDYIYEPSQITYDAAFSFNSDLEFDSFKAGIKHIIDKRICFNDVESLNTTIKLGGIELRSENSNILLNNEVVNEQNSSSKASSQGNSGEIEAIDIGNANGRIIKITIGVCVVFFIIVLISRRIERKKFFK
ncbi:DUF2334 domain-containing protein [Clostridium thailandense]|uniref:DUF2334 domain-containing protein n=1 Tax=Clostridium thailandense TaxID=2794346 RepID=UPI0039890BE9